MTIPSSSASRRARASDPCRRRFGAGLIAAAAMLALPDAPRAQQAEPATAPVLVIDMSRVQRDASAAKSIREQTAMLRKRIEAAIAEREQTIRAEEQALAEEREGLSPEDFRERIEAFEATVFANRDFAQREGAKLQAALTAASRRLRDEVAPILAAIMRERGAQVMLDTTQVVLSVDQLDVTEEVIARLDAVLPTLELALPDE